MFDRIKNQLIEEGREVEQHTLSHSSISVLFSDGTKLFVYPVGVIREGFKCTHAYVDKEILNSPNGIDLIEQIIKPSIIKGDFERFDTSGKQL
ncbi:hypothetical protein LAM21_21140, partial [Mycobacterium tuberculosis]|nr:hypothetical protein [Mycobacterium tuberculosis]